MNNYTFLTFVVPPLLRKVAVVKIDMTMPNEQTAVKQSPRKRRILRWQCPISCATRDLKSLFSVFLFHTVQLFRGQKKDLGHCKDQQQIASKTPVQ